MKGWRPEQATLRRETDMSKTDETRAVIEAMVDGLNDHRIASVCSEFPPNWSALVMALVAMSPRRSSPSG